MVLIMLLRSLFQVLAMHISRLWREYVAFLVVVTMLATGVWCVLFRAPSNFPSGSVLVIAPGTSATRAAYAFEEQKVIDSPFLFRVLVRLLPNVHGVQSGTYQFEKPAGLLTVVWNVTHGVSGLPTVRITFPEGTTVRQMGDVLATQLPNFDGEHFKSIALPYEGYLFPDTYFFLPGTTPEEATSLMRENFTAHSDWKSAGTLANTSERDVVIMASLLEGEAKTLTDKRIIAGILWKRISIGMALQVDATFGYDYGKTGYVPTANDLKGNSAYNSYRYKGLPPTPINNPGEVSLLAAVTPTKTDYLYYLTGTDGHMHYAKTFAEHIQNQKKYFK